MRISILAFGAVASILAINSVLANQVLTSQTYVDNADAQKVDIAQGTGTNNANVGKTLVVNSQGNLELGTVSASNFVEDSITDGVTNKAPSENAVNDALANKQNIIPVTGTNSSTPGTTVVTYTSTAGTVGERGIYDGTAAYNESTDADKLVTARAFNNPVPEALVTYKRCVRYITGQPQTSDYCLLWELEDMPVMGFCDTAADCPGTCNFCDQSTGRCYEDTSNCNNQLM